MAVFGIEIKNFNERIEKFIEDTKERLKEPSFAKNPFKGSIKKYPKVVVVTLQPLYPNLTPVGFLLLFVAMYLNRGIVTWWTLPGVCLVLSGFIWSKYFFFGMFTAGAKKAGYKDKIKLLTTEETLRRLNEHGTN